MRIVYIHGLEGSARGYKAQALARDFDLVSEQMDTSNFEACVTQQELVVANTSPDVVVGSSFGGAVAVAMLQRGLWKGPTLLLAPAVRELGLPLELPQGVPVLIVHGRLDSLIPPRASETLAGSTNSASLELVDDEHRLQSLCRPGELARRIQRLLRESRRLN